jgi:hypothetical protein
MQFNATVIQVETTTKPTKSGKGTYQQVEITFKRADTGKIESKKAMSFTNAFVFKAVVDSKPGDTLSIITEKNEDTGYWDWTKVTPVAPGQEAPVPQAKSSSNATTSPKSTYETPEERAKKQVYIVRQSSISNAIELLSIGAKTPPSTELVLKEAQKFVDFVFGIEQVDLFDTPNDFPEGEVS